MKKRKNKNNKKKQKQEKKQEGRTKRKTTNLPCVISPKTDEQKLCTPIRPFLHIMA